MQLEITRKFQKQVSGCNDKKVKSEIKRILEFAEMTESISEIKNLKKLKGYKNYFRIRLGDYRIGIQISENKIIFAAFDKRADIYKYFP
jgi:mRNA interferase RelE/StbE